MGHVIGEIADVTFSAWAVDAAFDFFVDAHGSFVRRRFVASDGFSSTKG
jgi:exosome complex RNA-binding protein Rrp4